MLMDIDPAGAGQGWLDLFAEEEASPELMQAMDRINAKYGRGGYGLRRAVRGSGTNRGKCVKSCAHRTTPHVSQTSPSHAHDCPARSEVGRPAIPAGMPGFVQHIKTPLEMQRVVRSMGTIMTTNITLHTKGTAAHNQFETFWTTGRKQGVIDITISNKETQDAAVIAELSAMHHLLSHKEICGSDRAGNGMEIEVTFGAIRKLAQNTSNKRHLFAHGRFLLTRYAEAKISVSKDNSWISMARAENRREQLVVDGPLPEVINVAGYGKVGLSFHIIERMMERANYASIGAAWRHLGRMLGNGKVSEVALPPEVAHQKAAKHGVAGKILRVAAEPWRFVLTNGARGKDTGLPMLVTAYVCA